MTFSGEEICSLDILARLQYLNVLSNCLDAVLARIEPLPDRESISYKVQLAVQELASNIVLHAYEQEPGKRLLLSVTLLPEPRCLHLTLRDTGRPFREDDAPPPNLDEIQEHGYGMFLIRELMDTVVYERIDEFNQWQLTKLLPKEKPQ